MNSNASAASVSIGAGGPRSNNISWGQAQWGPSFIQIKACNTDWNNHNLRSTQMLSQYKLHALIDAILDKHIKSGPLGERLGAGETEAANSGREHFG